MPDKDVNYIESVGKKLTGRSSEQNDESAEVSPCQPRYPVDDRLKLVSSLCQPYS